VFVVVMVSGQAQGHDAGGEPGGLEQCERRRTRAPFEQPLPGPDDDGMDQEMQLVEQTLAEEMTDAVQSALAARG
jgi:hypothetical protein